MTGPQRRRTLLLSGASGVLGRALIDELCADFHVVCLRHQARIADPRVEEIGAEIEAEDLGLGSAEYSRLAGRVDVVIHAAAATNWRTLPDDIRAANLAGTRSMLAFAERVQVPLTFVSTGFVANPPRVEGGRFAGSVAYIQSKVEAEALTRASAAETVIVRPSVIIGDSSDGRMAAFQGLHRVSGMIARGLLPLVACTADTLIDTVPQDVVAAAIGSLVRSEVRAGEYWLTAGEAAMTAGDVVEIALRLGRTLGLEPHPPRFVPAEAVDRLVLPLLEDVITPALRRTFLELLEMTWLFQAPTALPTSLPGLGLAEHIDRERQRGTFKRSMDFWAASRGLLVAEGLPREMAS